MCIYIYIIVYTYICIYIYIYIYIHIYIGYTLQRTFGPEISPSTNGIASCLCRPHPSPPSLHLGLSLNR